MAEYKIKINDKEVDPGEVKPGQAVALGYDPEHDVAPRILAVGKGITAEKIIEIAREHKIPIQEDPILTMALAKLDLDDVIPPELYTVVAEVLAYAYRVRGKQPDL